MHLDTFAAGVKTPFGRQRITDLMPMDFAILAFAQGYIALAVMLLICVVMVAAFLGLSYLLGPGRQGPVKSIPYESGVDPIGTARSRYHARFYLLAVLFLLFDVELIFFYPFAVLFHESRSGLFLVEIFIFSAILLVAFVYAWRKKIFDWR
jgi:NADH-quinone oxidoreductase subunit A